MAIRNVGNEGGIDTTELKAFIRALRRASPIGARGLRLELKAAGEIVAVKARQIASQHSTKIPATIKTSVRGATVSVVAGKGDPLAAIYELGNKGSKASETGTFKHPTFGNKNAWVEQPRWAFLRPAVDEAMPEVEVAVMKVADEVASSLTDYLHGAF